MMTQISSVLTTQTTDSVQSSQSASESRSTRSRRARNAQNKTNNLYAGNLNLGNASDEIEKKKKQAQKQAMKVISDAFSKEKDIDQMVNDNTQKIADLNAENSDYQDQISTINQRMDKLKDDYGVTDDSEEQQDLELLEKEQNSIDDPSNSEYELSEDENNRLQEIKDGGLTEYQSASLDCYKEKNFFEGQVDDNNKKIIAYNESTHAINKARLKSHPMVDAQKTSDQIIDSANAEIKGMIVDEAKDHIDEVMEEKKEEVLDQKKDKEELEQQIEKAKEKNQDQSVETTDDDDDSEQDDEVDQASKVGDTIIEAQQQVDEILKKMKLTLEDVKGMEVDSNI